MGLALTLLSAADCSRSHTEERAAQPGACPAQTGRLAATLTGSIQREIAWQGQGLSCGGMPRPEGDGIRLRFRSVDGQDPLIVLVGFRPAGLGEESRANITIMVEDRGVFFSNQQRDSCWVRLTEKSALSSVADVEQFSGLVWCISALPQVNGTGTVGVGDIEFVGFAPWPNDAE